jgi:CRP-like cAMP-binding protein
MVQFHQPDCVACLPEAFVRVLAQDPEVWARWLALPARNLPAGHTLLALGQAPSHVWWIRKGLVRFFFLSPEGAERNKSFHAEGAWIGSGMPPHPAPSPYAIQTLEASELIEVSYAELADCVRRYPTMHTVLQEALSWTFTRQAVREAELLLQEPAARYQHFLREHPKLAARLPLHHIASHLGITNVALSRIRRRLGLQGRGGAPA